MSHESARQRPEAVLIAGPTASGKSALALRLAQRLGGSIVNADSMQVYRDLRVLTARPSKAEMATVPHHLYGTIDGAQNHSVSLWLADARFELAHANEAGVVPIFVGGTGLYFKALTQGLSEIPPVPEVVRQTLRNWAAGRTPETLHQELARRDPATAARLRPTDPQRLLRALEVHEATGEGLARFQQKREQPALSTSNYLAVTLTIERDALRARIDERFDRMIQEGALEEVRALAARALDPALPVMRAIGVPQLRRHLSSESLLEEAVTEAKSATRQYIKRQETFMRHQLPGFRPSSTHQAEEWLLAAYHS